MTVKFITVKGSESMGRSPFYVGIPQHERTIPRREAYELIAAATGYTPTAVKAVFMAAAEYVRENQRRGNITFLDGVASIRNYVRGAFEGLTGPWVKGRNILLVHAVEMAPFKTVLAAVTPINRTEGANPVINSVLDETTLVYDEITGTNLFSIAGADLAPDQTKEDEYVALANAQGVETKAEITFSDLQHVKAQLAAALEPGDYTLRVYTRSGLGDQYGVHVASRKVKIA
jgi:hypothetical protein